MQRGGNSVALGTTGMGGRTNPLRGRAHPVRVR
jgi:hypothetical protein